MSPSTASASKCSVSTTVPPKRCTMVENPIGAAWCSGPRARCTVEGPKPYFAAYASDCSSAFPAGVSGTSRRTPLGRPEVPDENQSGAPSRPSATGVVGIEAIASSNQCQPSGSDAHARSPWDATTKRCRTAAAREASTAASIRRVDVTSTRAPDASRISADSSPVNMLFTNVYRNPERNTAQVISKARRWFSISNATVSPTCRPSARKSCAVWFERSSSSRHVICSPVRARTTAGASGRSRA